MSVELRGVVVGAGYFSRFQFEAWDRIPEAKIVGVCDRSIEKAEEAARRHGIAVVGGEADFESMLDELHPDFVDLITPPATHLDLCRAACERGIDIICQKPLAPTWEESLRLAALISGSRSRFMVHENFRWQPWYREIRRMLAEGVIGEFFHLFFLSRLGDGWGEDAYLDRQPFFRDYPRLFLFETGIHFFDTFRYLAGEIESVYAVTARRNPVIAGEDSALVVCHFENGGTAVLDANRFSEGTAENPRYTFGTMRVEGSRGHIDLDTDGGILIKRLGQGPVRHPYQPSREGFAGDCVHALQRHFVDSVIGGLPFESGVDDYLRSVRVVEAAYESARTGRPVRSAIREGTRS